MVSSASPSGLSERMAATSTRLTSVFRHLTAQHGLAGFTIEEACSEVGVSRRTFFNYFPSKEEAVIGIVEREDLQRFGEEFMDRGSHGWPAVVDDLIALVIDHFRAVGIGANEQADLLAAIGREPRLLARFMEINREREHQLAELIAARELVDLHDPHVQAAIQAVAVVLRMSAAHVHAPETADRFPAVVSSSLAALRTVLATTPPNSKDIPL